MATEKLKFVIELWATYWDKKPIAEILINDKSYIKQEIDGTQDDPTIIEFEHELTEGESYNLIINRSNKDNTQTMVESGKIVKDQMLCIKSVQIDEIDIGALIYEGVYRPEYPEPWASQQKQQGVQLPETVKNCDSMGHNGTWTFKFDSPFYMWLLENLY